MNIKAVYKCIATTVLLSQLIAPNILHAQTTSDLNQPQNDMMNQGEYGNSGLMGYYYNDRNFKELAMMTPEKNGEFKIIKENHGDLLSKEKQIIQSIRWMGYIKPSESGEYIFSTSEDSKVIMQLDGKTVINHLWKTR